MHTSKEVSLNLLPSISLLASHFSCLALTFPYLFSPPSLGLEIISEPLFLSLLCFVSFLSFPKAQVLSFVCTCGACASNTHLHTPACASHHPSSDSCHCPDLGHCGLRGFEVIDESYPFIHYWRRRSKPRHRGYHRDSPADQTEVKRGGSRRRTWGRGGHLSKEVEVRSEGEGGEMHRGQESWEDGRGSILNSSIAFLIHSALSLLFFFIQALSQRLWGFISVQLSPHKKLQRSKNNIKEKRARAQSE